MSVSDIIGSYCHLQQGSHQQPRIFFWCCSPHSLCLTTDFPFPDLSIARSFAILWKSSCQFLICHVIPMWHSSGSHLALCFGPVTSIAWFFLVFPHLVLASFHGSWCFRFLFQPSVSLHGVKGFLLFSLYVENRCCFLFKPSISFSATAKSWSCSLQLDENIRVTTPKHCNNEKWTLQICFVSVFATRLCSGAMIPWNQWGLAAIYAVC